MASKSSTIRKNGRRTRRKYTIRKGVYGTEARPRLTVYRTAKHIYAQIINDSDGKTLVSSSSMAKDVRANLKSGGNADGAKFIGGDLAEKALAAGITDVVFDRNGFRYHGRLQALADAAREKGLKF